MEGQPSPAGNTMCLPGRPGQKCGPVFRKSFYRNHVESGLNSEAEMLTGARFLSNSCFHNSAPEQGQ
jgi:hypothetical protein